MNAADQFMTALCLWREARGEKIDGITAVACVLRNRVNKHNSSYYAEVIKKWQFSSITAPGDPQLVIYPQSSDSDMMLCMNLAVMVAEGNIVDPTGGATLYYDDSIKFPSSWDKSKVEPTVKIGRLNFFKEI